MVLRLIFKSKSTLYFLQKRVEFAFGSTFVCTWTDFYEWAEAEIRSHFSTEIINCPTTGYYEAIAFEGKKVISKKNYLNKLSATMIHYQKPAMC